MGVGTQLPPIAFLVIHFHGKPTHLEPTPSIGI